MIPLSPRTITDMSNYMTAEDRLKFKTSSDP